MNKGKVLITGANGFIGHHLVSWYEHSSAEAIAVCRSVQQLQSRQSNARWVSIELSSPDFCKLVAEARPDVLIHCAGPSSVSKSFDNPAQDLRDSLDCLENVLEAVRRNAPSCRIIFLSSAAVYGNALTLPINEQTPPSPISPYGYHKLLCEELIGEYRLLFCLEVYIARIFSAFGPGLMRQVFWDVCEKASSGNIIHLDGTGTETRDFIYIRDLIMALDKLAETKELEWPVYNVASGCSITIHDAAASMLRALNKERVLEFSNEQRHGDPRHWESDITRLATTGFSTTVSLEKGLAEYARWYAGSRQNG